MLKRSLKNKRILITCGPTWVAIDPVRVISNISSGRLGQLLALKCQKSGAKVTLLEGAVTRPLETKGIRIRKFQYFDELFTLLRRELRKGPHIVIHAAAIADYRPRRVSREKIRSRRTGLHIDLVPTFKMIDRIKRIAPRAFLVGFKLDPQMDPVKAKSEVRRLIRHADCDLVIANSRPVSNYNAYIFNKALKIIVSANSREQVTTALVKVFKDLL